MNYLKFFLLCLTFTVVIVSCDDDDEVNELETTQEKASVFENLDQNPNARLLYRTVANFGISDVFNAGENTPIPVQGRRMNFQFSGEISGSFTGADYAILQAEAPVDIDVFGVITTDDNANISFRYRGISISTSETGGTIQETGFLTSYDPRYEYLNDLYIVVVGESDFVAGTLTLNYYAFEEDPFNGKNPYAEPEIRTDYRNFPFTWDNIQNNPNATLVYEGISTVNNTIDFGIDVPSIFAGNQVPADGARVDFEFEGTTTGELNGQLKGIDFSTILPDGTIIVDVRGTIVTQDGASVALDVEGLSIPSTTSGISNFFETATLNSYSDSLSYLNDKYIIGVGTSDNNTGLLTLRLYRFDQDPLN